MVFSSPVFLFQFLPFLLLVYFFIKEKYYNLTLLLFSLAFYAWGEPRNILLMLISIGVNYTLARLIDSFPRWRICGLVISIIYNLSVLYVFKYFNFSVNIINRFLSDPLVVPTIALPIGISFFTFQIMSYVIDVYRKQVPVQKNILDLALYISLFPQLIAGPIVRYVDVVAQIKKRTCSLSDIYEGILRFAVGFSKKVLIADQLAPLVDTAFSNTRPSLYVNWIGMIAYTLQIYFDFSGYSDMAIGLGKVFGFQFLENFNYPYISRSVREFWRRWHISLSTWFRDYVYIPLGGNRCGTARTYLNLIIVFFLTGLWHGASFNFIVWGLYYGFFLVLERTWLSKVLEKMPRIIQHVYTILVVMVGWVFFRAENLLSAVSYLKGLVTFTGSDFVNLQYIMTSEYWFFIFVGIFFSIPLSKAMHKVTASKATVLCHNMVIFCVFLISIFYMVGTGFSPFLYFRF